MTCTALYRSLYSLSRCSGCNCTHQQRCTCITSHATLACDMQIGSFITAAFAHRKCTQPSTSMTPFTTAVLPSYRQLSSGAVSTRLLYCDYMYVLYGRTMLTATRTTAGHSTSQLAVVGVQLLGSGPPACSGLSTTLLSDNKSVLVLGGFALCRCKRLAVCLFEARRAAVWLWSEVRRPVQCSVHAAATRQSRWQPRVCVWRRVSRVTRAASLACWRMSRA